jgi:hypothetical protein
VSAVDGSPEIGDSGNFSAPGRPLWGPARGTGDFPTAPITDGPANHHPVVTDEQPALPVPAEPPVSTGPEARRARGPMIAVSAAVTAFLAVTAVVVVVAVNGGGSAKQSSAAGDVAAPYAVTTYPTDFATTGYPPASSTPVSTSAESTAATESTPSGYRRTTGPAGVEVTIPADWPVKSGSIPSNDQADAPDGTGSFLRYGGTPTPSMPLLDAVAENESTNSGIRVGYQRLRLDQVSDSGGESVVWEFLFTKSGQQRHALGRFWRANGYDYVVYASSTVSRWDELQPVLAVFTQSPGPR